MKIKLLLSIIFIILSAVFTSAIDIETCGPLVAGSHTLTQDISADADTCFSFTENDIELDCHGHTIDGLSTFSVAFDINGMQNITIRNCTVTNFIAMGIQIVSVSNSVFEDIMIQNIDDGIGSSGSGIVCDTVDGNTFERISIDSCALSGIELYYSTNNIENFEKPPCIGFPSSISPT